MKLNESILSNLKEGAEGKKDFTVYIEETVSQGFTVEAVDDEEAADIAMEKYKNGEFVLEPGELTMKQMMVEDPETGDTTEWFEF